MEGEPLKGKGFIPDEFVSVKPKIEITTYGVKKPECPYCGETLTEEDITKIAEPDFYLHINMAFSDKDLEKAIIWLLDKIDKRGETIKSEEVKKLINEAFSDVLTHSHD